MYLKKLELVGFKSFMNKTTLHFDPGITTVVGPNGTGKSNIFDSIRWVLGEQSAKALRGSEMQDVIFNGTDAKDPLSMAEVTLTFDNSKRFLSVDHDEVTITRRVFRSGEGEYLLNKTQVRLKDTLDLLSGSGMALEGYSLVEQGKVDLILSVRPEERRLVFDEAAGITKYKIQKKETARRLEETEQNLLRVNDIIVEVKRQIGSLERQASKARRYKEVFEELKSKEVNLAVRQRQDLEEQKHKITRQLQQFQTQEVDFINLIEGQESQISDYREELKSLESNIMEAKNLILNLDSLIARDKEHIKFNKERIVELDNTKRYLVTQFEKTKDKLVIDEEKLNDLKKEYRDIEKNIKEKSFILEGKQIQLNNISLAIKTSQNNIVSGQKKIVDLVARLANVKNEISDLNAQQQTHLARQKRLQIEKAKVNEEKITIEDNLNNSTQELEGLDKNYQDLNLKTTQLKEELEREESSLSQIKIELGQLERQRLVLKSQKEFLEKLKTKYEDIAESMNAVIYLDRLPDGGISGLVVKVKECSKVNKTEKIQESARFKLSGEAKPIDLDTQRVNDRINQVEGKIATLTDSKATKENRIKELDKAIQDAQHDLRNKEIVLVDKRARHKSLSEQFNKIKEEEDIILIELVDVEKEVTTLQKKIASLQSEVSTLSQEQKQAEEIISSEQDNIALNNNLKEEILVAITQLKTEIDSLNKKVSSDATTLRILEDTFQADKERLSNFETQIKNSSLKQESLDSEIKDLENRIIETGKEQTNKNIQLEGMEDRYRDISEDISTVVKKIDSDRKDLDMLKRQLHELQMQNKDVDFKIASIKERILQGYKLDLDTIEDTAQEIDESRLYTQEWDEGTLSSDIQRLKEKLDSYGTVNLVAIEEYDELKKRYDFLTQQQNDLISAKESLHQAILKINRTARKMFLETFQQISQEFRNYFRLLFNGGDTQIFLTDEQDPLESGIEIICRPPGKKLQNVLLLSGGEKALSAIALLFAIFKVRPSPFCVLDEIDAALDEANVDRFSRILQEFVKSSQFIIITHNKRTIANTDVMYGITMEESGVSKIVSVKFKETPRPKEDSEAVAKTVSKMV